MKHIIEFFESTVERCPNHIAISCPAGAFTFRELKEHALRIAARIQRTIGGVHQPVAVVAERDADTILYFLAVLYSGNFYVPIDPDLPMMKKKSILEECEPGVILCSEERREMVRDLTDYGCIITALDQADQVEDLLPVTYRAEDPAYMVYTSGSTGKPKGVLKSHGSVCSFIEAFTQEFGLTEEEVIGNQTPFFFDASAKDIYLMLYTGARMEVLPAELFVLPPKLINYLNEKKVTYVCWVPTALAIVAQLNTFQLVVPETLKKVFFVGEVFPLKQLQKWIAQLPNLEYVNLYGSTELAGISCFYRIDTGRELTALPMGRPLSNCHVFLYDTEKQCVIREAGQTGEVCVVSEALADAYYKDPEKTAKNFSAMEVTEALWEAGMPPVGTVVRVLHTGDLARYDAEGNLVFASRKDFQIKHMGRRIELGEIESIADQLPEIQRCCCLYDAEKRKIRLFCELIAGCEWKSRDVRSALKGHLTDYMLPGSVTIMEKLPLNANGKIDRSRLKAL